MGRGGAIHGAPSAYVNAFHRQRVLVNNFASGSDISEGAANSTATLWQSDIGGAHANHLVSLSPIVQGAYRGEVVAAFRGSNQVGQGSQWNQGSMIASGFTAPNGWDRPGVLTSYWCGELAINSGIGVGQGTVFMGMNNPLALALMPDGTLPIDAQAIGFYINTTGEIRAVHTNHTAIVVNTRIGTYTSQTAVRFALVSRTTGVDGEDVYRPGSSIEWYINEHLVLVRDPTPVDIFEPDQYGPMIAVVKTGGGAGTGFTWRVPYWAMAYTVRGDSVTP